MEEGAKLWFLVDCPCGYTTCTTMPLAEIGRHTFIRCQECGVLVGGIGFVKPREETPGDG